VVGYDLVLFVPPFSAEPENDGFRFTDPASVEVERAAFNRLWLASQSIGGVFSRTRENRLTEVQATVAWLDDVHGLAQPSRADRHNDIMQAIEAVLR